MGQKAFSFMHFVPKLFTFSQIIIVSVDSLTPRGEGYMLGMVRLVFALPAPPICNNYVLMII
jgi:hypothetical protein